jgi:hypothetical protein
LQQKFASQVDVPPDRQFIGFDAYQKGDGLFEAGRHRHFRHAAGVSLGAFHLRHPEGPECLYGEAAHGRRPTSKRMFKLGTQAQAKNLKVGVGLMSRHSRALEELAKRVHDGEIGQIILQRGYRMHGPGGYFSSLPKPPVSPTCFTRCSASTASSGPAAAASTTFISTLIDHLGWMKNEWPVKAQALGGRHYR